MEEINKSIKNTRKGFIYQDKCALFVFLDLFIDKKIRKFYVDYSYNRIGNSLDIRALIYLDGKDQENIYEVKAKEKIKKGDPIEFGETLLSLWEYKKKEESVKRYLIVEPEINSQVTLYWATIKDINERKLLMNKKIKKTLKVNKSVEYLLDELKYKDGKNEPKKSLKEAFETEDEFIAFIRSLNFCLGNSKDSDNLGCSDLDGLIEMKLNGIAEKICKAKDNDFLFSNSILIDILINVIANGASELSDEGSNVDILPLIIDKIADYFSRRRIDHEGNGRLDDKLTNETESIKTKLYSFINIASSEENNVKSGEVYEGKEIS